MSFNRNHKETFKMNNTCYCAAIPSEDVPSFIDNVHNCYPYIRCPTYAEMSDFQEYCDTLFSLVCYVYGELRIYVDEAELRECMGYWDEPVGIKPVGIKPVDGLTLIMMKDHV
jgi:hypothetical protein